MVEDRVAYLAGLVAGKRLLDIGVVDHMILERDRKGSDWLHGQLAGVASYSLGVDVLEDDVRRLREEGYNVVVGDVTSLELEERFDVVVAGEVIEHLDSPASVFALAAKTLVPGGRLVVTTPYPFYVGRVWKNWRGAVSDSVDHVGLFWPSGLIEYAERYGLTPDVFRPVAKAPGSRIGKAVVAMKPLWTGLGFSELAMAETAIYEFVFGNPSVTDAHD